MYACVCVCLGQKRKLTLLSFRLADVGWVRHEKEGSKELLSNTLNRCHTLGSFSGGEVRIKNEHFNSRG